MKRFWDWEYDRVVTEDVPRQQYESFRSEWSWWDKPYEKFLAENFYPLEQAGISIEGMVNIHDEHVDIREMPNGEIWAILEGQAWRKFKDYDTAVSKLYKAGFIF